MTDTNPNAAAIERDIEQTQSSISDTVDQLQKKLNPRTIIDQLLGDEDASGQQLLTAAKNNPLAVGLIGVGALLLASGKSPSLSGLTAGRSSRDSDSDAVPARGSSGRSFLRSKPDYHSNYIEHMSRCQPREGEDDASYMRRRDLARADYFMIDRNHDEDEGGFRQRLNEAQEKLRSKTAAFGDKIRAVGHDTSDSLGDARSAFSARGKQAYGSARDAYGSAREWSGNTGAQLSDQYQQNPAIGGLVAAALGAAFGAAIPATEIEREKLGGISEKARDVITEQKEKVVEKAHAALEPAQGGGQASGQGSDGAEPSAFAFGDKGATQA